MSTIVLISGSPSAPSKSSVLLDYVRDQLKKHGLSSVMISMRDFPAEDLMQARWDSPAFDHAKQQIAAAAAVVIATPVYKASYTGVLKSFLDILPQSGFRGKTLLPIMTGGSPGHLLAIDFAMKPVLSAMGATDVLQGVYSVDTQFTRDANGNTVVADEILKRLDDAVAHLVTNVSGRGSAATA